MSTAPEHPPQDAPPVLFTQDYRADGAPLRVEAAGAGAVQGHGASPQSFRDVVLDVRAALADGDEQDLYGVFVRQGGDRRFVAWALSPAGRCLIGLVDGALQPVVDSALAPELSFARGVGAANRFQVLACGPSLTFVLNGMVVTGITVDQRFKDGYVGVFVQHGGAGERAVLAADWLQVRAVLPGQPARPPQ